LFVLEIATGRIEVVGSLDASGRLVAASGDHIFGMDGNNHLFEYDVTRKELDRKSVVLPDGNWRQSPLIWAKGDANETLYLADGDGRIFSFSRERGFSEVLGTTGLCPVKTMAETHDGRVFGFCGEEMANMFCFNPDTREMTNLGVAVSVIERRRYGYLFSDAAVGRDGQIFFAENDDLGHLWMFFPAILPKRSAT
jgi:hypothetical protein